ncbi:protein TolR [Halomonas daqingensis]|uniref:Tol-Pal system protein TolR n=1 Tax=Billgrantia desiderata TaxID=52021 RepID=A0AAW4YSN8_9GAMM|nr:protein TolR [Halomonas desiderata]MCE8050860.1 protein TolR [Halomonas desiderata]
MHGPFNRGGRRKPMGEINVVPFIDVMLVLLVIFMITAPMLTQGVQIELPQVTSEPIDSQEDRDPIIVSVDREGDYYLSIGGEEMAVDLEELGDRVLILIERQPGTQVMVRGDRFVPYGEVVTLMSTLQVSGVTNVGLISEPPPRD